AVRGRTRGAPSLARSGAGAMSLLVVNVGAYNLEILGVIAAAALAVGCFRLPQPAWRLAYWRVVLMAALLVPLLVHPNPVAQRPSLDADVQYFSGSHAFDSPQAPSQLTVSHGEGVSAGSVPAQPAAQRVSSPRRPWTGSTLVLAVLIGGAVIRLL